MEGRSRQNSVTATPYHHPYPAAALGPLTLPPLLPPFHRVAGLPPLPAASPDTIPHASEAQHRHRDDRKRRLSTLSAVSPPSARHRRPPGPPPTSLSAHQRLSAPSNAPSSSMTMNPAGHAASSQAPASPNVIDLTSDDRPPEPSQPAHAQDPSPEYALPRWQPDGDVHTCPVCGVDFTFWNRKHHCRCVLAHPPPRLSPASNIVC
jgi:hypothetical protein